MNANIIDQAEIVKLRGVLLQVRKLTDDPAIAKIIADALAPPAYRFPMVSCSQCGGDFGPGNDGFSHCDNHAGMRRVG